VGEKPVRGNVSSVNGVWKSADAGKTLEKAGLEEKSIYLQNASFHPK